MVITTKKWCRNLYILVILSAINTGCKNNPNIDGLWIGTRTIYNDTLIESALVRPIVLIKDDTLYYRTIGNIDGVYDRVDSLKTRYQFKNTGLYLNRVNENISLEHITQDSILAFYPNKPDKKMVFNKIIENYRTIHDKKLFQGKQFSYRGNRDSTNLIHFTDDSLALSFNSKESLVTSMKWELIHFNEQNFLVLTDAIGPVSMHIDSINQHTIYLSEYSGAKNYPFQELTNSTGDIELPKGDWQIDVTLEALPSKQSKDTIGMISFHGNGISFKSNGTKFRKNLVFKSQEKEIFFSGRPITNSSLWKIKQLTDNEILLTEYSKEGNAILQSKYKKMGDK